MHLEYLCALETKHASGINALDRILYWLAGFLIQSVIKHINELECLFLVSHGWNRHHQYLGLSCLQIDKQSCILSSGNHVWECHIDFLLHSKELDTCNIWVREVFWQFVFHDTTRFKRYIQQVFVFSHQTKYHFVLCVFFKCNNIDSIELVLIIFVKP